MRFYVKAFIIFVLLRRISTIRIEGIVVSLASLSVYIVQLDCVLTIQKENVPFLWQHFQYL